MDTLKEHQSEPIREAKGATILWGFVIQAAKKMKSNGPDINDKDYKRNHAV